MSHPAKSHQDDDSVDGGISSENIDLQDRGIEELRPLFEVAFDDVENVGRIVQEGNEEVAIGSEVS